MAKHTTSGQTNADRLAPAGPDHGQIQTKTITVRPNGRKRVQTFFTEPSRTLQLFKDETDVNNIMKKYLKTGLLPVSGRTGFYADLTEVSDYQDSLHKVMRAEKAFLDLPADVRKKFSNDPNELIQFLSNPANKSEAIALGLVQKPADPDPGLEILKEISSNTKPKKPKPADD